MVRRSTWHGRWRSSSFKSRAWRTAWRRGSLCSVAIGVRNQCRRCRSSTNGAQRRCCDGSGFQQGAADA